MPLFFFLSGLVFRNRENETYFDSLKKDIKRILIPYFTFAFISLFLWFTNLPSQDQTLHTIFKQIVGIIYGNASNGYLAINTVLWFLPCLFIVKQIFWFIAKLNKNALIGALVIFSIIGFISSTYFSHIRLPFGIESALTGVVFFGVGFLWNSLPQKINTIIIKYGVFLIIPFIFFTIYFADLNYQAYGLQIDVRLNRLNNYFYFYIAAFSGILATILISKLINKNAILEYLGQKTMVLFIWHYFVFIYISKIFFIFVDNKELISFRNAYYPFIYTTLSIIVILTIDKLYLIMKNKFKLVNLTFRRREKKEN